MKVYKQVAEDAEYREYYDSYRVTVENLNDTDYLYRSSLSDGQVYFSNSEMYGFINNQAAIRGKNITITKDYIDNFVIRDFIVFSRALNNTITLNINCNLKDYRDGKPHYLYIVLSNKGKYEVYDDMFQSDETKLIFARFIIDKLGNSEQFYIMLPFAGSADYLKGNQFYQVTDGLRVSAVNNSSKELTLSNAKIRFSAINFDDMSSPDCLEVNFDGASMPIRYCVWDTLDAIPRVDWTATTVSTLDSTKVMDYRTGDVSTVSDNQFSIQKLYYDVYEKCIVAMYGNKAYATKEEAIYGIDTILDYPKPDGIDYLIPIAAIISQNSKDAYSDENFRVINLDYNEKEVLDSDTFTRQQSAEAVQKSRQALETANEVNSALVDHEGDRTNPHQVRLNQLYNSEGKQVVLDDSYADNSVSSILASALTQATDKFYAKTGGTISGNTSITGTLSVAGKSTLANTAVNGDLTVSGNLNPSTNAKTNLGSTSLRLATIYATSLNVSGDTYIGGTTSTGAVRPNASATYDLGTSSLRYNTMYGKALNLSGDGSISGALSVSGALTIGGGTTFNNWVTVASSKVFKVSSQGYLQINGVGLCLGSLPSGLPAGTNYALY